MLLGADSVIRRLLTRSHVVRFVSWAAFGMWCAVGPFSTTSRDDSGFNAAAPQWRIWSWIAKYLFRGQVRMLNSEEWLQLGPKQLLSWREDHPKPYVMSMHPHGLLPFGAILNGMTGVGGGMTGATASGAQIPAPSSTGPLLHQTFFPHIVTRAAIATGAFWFPGAREIYRNLGCIEISKPFVRALLRRGRTVGICVGGADESRYARPGRYVVCALKHKGHLRLAVEEHLDILPVYTFGEESFVPQASWVDHKSALTRLQVIMKEVTGLMCPPSLGGLPNFVPLTTVVGVPVSLADLWCGDVGSPVTDLVVDKAHARYLEALQRLFDMNKAFVPGGHADAVLEII